MDYISPEGLDRRRFLQYAAGVGAMIGLAGSSLLSDSLASAQETSAASAHSRLPDGELATQVFASGDITLEPPGITVTVEEFYLD